MSVYTSVSKLELEKFLQQYPLGELIDFQGISDGIENTNYFVDTSKGNYVLTLFEVLSKKELPFFVELMAFLNEHSIPSAHPVKDNHQSYLRELSGKPALMVQRLHGKSIDNPTVTHCAAIGSVLAELHVQGQSFELIHANSRGTQWRNDTGKQLLTLLPEDDAALLENELRNQALQDYKDLPVGIVHADLFRDNVLFDAEELTGILDLYNACNDFLLYDVAITVNDWCVTDRGALDFARARELCTSYSLVRKLTSSELALWPVMLRIAAMRFWLSRLWSVHNPREGELTFQKDPEEFKNIILARLREGNRLREVW